MRNNPVEDDEFNKVYNNEECRKIMAAASKPYFRYLSPEEIESCKMKAVFTSLLRYDESKGCKYNTYLYTGVKYECKSQYNAKFRHKKIEKNYEIIEGAASFGDNCYDLLEVINKVDVDNTFRMKYIEGYTVKEISEKTGFTRQGIHNKLTKIKKQIRELLL